MITNLGTKNLFSERLKAYMSIFPSRHVEIFGKIDFGRKPRMIPINVKSETMNFWALPEDTLTFGSTHSPGLFRLNFSFPLPKSPFFNYISFYHSTMVKFVPEFRLEPNTKRKNRGQGRMFS